MDFCVKEIFCKNFPYRNNGTVWKSNPGDISSDVPPKFRQNCVGQIITVPLNVTMHDVTSHFVM